MHRFRPWLGRRVVLFPLLAAGCLSLCGSMSGHRAWAQYVRSGGGNSPPAAYYAAFHDLYEGRYQRAARDFTRVSPLRFDVNTPWVDAVCYETMAGECLYHLGEIDRALSHFRAALQMAEKYPSWMLRLQFPDIREANPGAYARIPWDTRTERIKVAQINDSMQIILGDFITREKLLQGGRMMKPFSYSVNATEIVRCTALALRRWRELTGPAAGYDPLSAEMLRVFTGPVTRPNHWSQAWKEILLGLSYSAAGDAAQATSHLRSGRYVAGEFYHPLSASALVELGRIAMVSGNLQQAAAYLREATYAAVYFEDVSSLEDAFRYGLLTHLMGNDDDLYPPLKVAAEWLRRKSYPDHLVASVALMTAENAAVRHMATPAQKSLGMAKALMARSEMGLGRHGTRLYYVNSLLQYQQGRVKQGDELLNKALALMVGGSKRRGGSHWLLHIRLADAMYESQRIAPRRAMLLYAQVLRDPTPADWAFDPLECLAVLKAPPMAAMQRWFEVAKGRQAEAAIWVADQVRRRRFYSQLPLGGRLVALRWVLEGPESLLNATAILERRNLRARYPNYTKLSVAAENLRREIRGGPPVFEEEDGDKRRQQAKQLAGLANVSGEQEEALREIAIRREACAMIFPPSTLTRDIQAQLPEGRAVVSYMAVRGDLYAFLLTKELRRYAAWKVGPVAKVQSEIRGLLRAIGNYDANRPLKLADLKSNTWKKKTSWLYERLLQPETTHLPDGFSELVIVPDACLWYLPFELLQVPARGVGDASDPLVARIGIRYVPTTSLAVPDARGRNQTPTVGVVVGKLFPQDDVSVAQTAFDELRRLRGGTFAIPNPLPTSSAVFAGLFDELLVFDEIKGQSSSANWSPMQIDRGRPGSTLSDWLSLPWHGPDLMVLPGYHTAAENSLKNRSSASTGSEVFLSVCGAMAAGSRTLLLSRWRMGGQIGTSLVREFLEELPHTTASQAWRRAVLLGSASPLLAEVEPRVDVDSDDVQLTGGHPLLWSGYMLIDNGVLPQADDRPEVVVDLDARQNEVPFPAGGGPDAGP